MANYSILDLVPITEGSDASTALERSKELAILADESGFTRYWVAEHHNMPGIASSATSVVIGHLALLQSAFGSGQAGLCCPIMHRSLSPSSSERWHRFTLTALTLALAAHPVQTA